MPGETTHRPTYDTAPGVAGQPPASGDTNHDTSPGVAGQPTASGNHDRGFPSETPVADMTDPQKIAYYRWQSRKHEETAKNRSDYDDLKKQLADLRAASMSEQERTVDAARAEGEIAGRSAAAAEYTRALVDAELRAMITPGLTGGDGVVDTARRDALIGHLDHNRFVKDGKIDTEALQAWADTVAPRQTKNPAGWPSLGQGRTDPTGTSPADQGRAEAARRFGVRSEQHIPRRF